ncbi:MAG: CYTH domain-containing protein [Succinivibrionaceae bacterium]|nr:CYTH domain-containing protein [Succinivibrionaceae bacterium]
MDNVEVELKFGVLGEVDRLFAALGKLGETKNPQREDLRNVYFDTEDKRLFAMNAGLRIRRGPDCCEQTLKIRGNNVGGLHEREEYSVPLERTRRKPDLSLFPRDAFPRGTDLKDLERRLRGVCEINFNRERCDLYYKDCVFEVSWDRGVIKGGSQTFPINEVEIELKDLNKTREEALLVMSSLVTSLAQHRLALTLEPFSKMHRASLLLDNDRNTQQFIGIKPFLDLHSYIIELLSVFDNMYGLLLVKREPLMLGCLNASVKILIRALKELRLKGEVALLGRTREPIDYREDLDHIIKRLKQFHGLCRKLEKKFIAHALEGDTYKLEQYVDEIKTYANVTQAFIVPLKIRVLLSLLIKSDD